MRVRSVVSIDVPIAADIDTATGACEGWWVDLPDDLIGAMRGTIRDCKNDGAVEPTLAVLLMDLDDDLDTNARIAAEAKGDEARNELRTGEGE